MKYAHFSDVHIGSWRDPKMRDLSTIAFQKAVDFCIEQKVDFILLAGDLFNTSMPTIDHLKSVVIKLKELKIKNIPVYAIAGSHDFSPSGKTMLDVLEKAGLLYNVVKGIVENEKLKLSFTIDVNTGAKITGMIGKKGMLEKKYYETLNLEHLEKEEGYKIFLFHTAINEFKPLDLEKMEASPLSVLPKGFDYYAGGHVHYIFQRKEEGYGLISYSGALFPANFKELEQFGCGGVYIVNTDENNCDNPNGNSDNNKNNHNITLAVWHPIKVIETEAIPIDCDAKVPIEIEEGILSAIDSKDFTNTIVLLRFKGMLREQKVSDINFKRIFQSFFEKNAYFVLKNSNALSSTAFEEVKLAGQSVEEIELLLLQEHMQSNLTENDSAFAQELLHALNKEKIEGERVIDFENRILDTVKEMFEF